MPYEFHIGNEEDNPVALEKWKEAVEKIDGIRLATGDSGFTSPKGEVVRIKSREGDAAVYFPDSDRWINVFRFSGGEVSFNAPRDLDDPHDLVMKIAFQLAEELGCGIFGDEGEEYRPE